MVDITNVGSNNDPSYFHRNMRFQGAKSDQKSTSRKDFLIHLFIKSKSVYEVVIKYFGLYHKLIKSKSSKALSLQKR